MSAQTYSVPVILPDLRKEESIQQLVNALEYLDAVANDIFNRISSRVAENRDQLTGLNNRINVAQAKIDKLRTSSTKATRVFATPKYPAPKSISHYQSVFHDVHPGMHRVQKAKANFTSRVPEVTQEALTAKRKPPYILKLEKKKKFREGVVVDDLEQIGEGLGSVPRHIESVSSLLLFNTSENPYKKYVILDPLSGAQTKTREAVDQENQLPDAPESILKGEMLERGPQDSTIYQPIMADLPELEVPLSLPTLTHVAVDETYIADLGPSIAPSLANTTVPDLPNLAEPSSVATTDILPEPSSGPPPPPGPATAPPPPPPPPPVAAAAPPPPPPPQDSDDSDSGEGGDEPLVEGDARASLMDAIRKAGGASKAGLASSKQRKKERKKKKEEADSPGDLLNDLSAALGRRRKAMSGGGKKDDAPSLGGGSMMDKISAMIPPPPGPGEGGSDGFAESGEGGW